jgi:hypothetical protein
MNKIILEKFNLGQTYQEIKNLQLQDDTQIHISDHMGGFDKHLKNPMLDSLQELANKQNSKILVYTSYIVNETIARNYPELIFKLDVYDGKFFDHFYNYHTHPALDFQNFLCSFNGSSHVSRRLLVCILRRFGWFNPKYCSKNFSFTTDMLDGHIENYVADSDRFYRKFFIDPNDEKFFETIYQFGLDPYLHTSNDHANNIYKLAHNPEDHANNIYMLEKQITQSFLNLSSETMATSYYPMWTEKFLYSIVTRGLFVSYAPPTWHQQIEDCMGFRLYNKLFDYRFDQIQNPIERLIELMSMISKFSKLSTFDWHDLYELEKESIEYNHDHYFSRNYIKNLEQFL